MISQNVFETLTKIVGSGNVITDKAELVCYAYDASTEWHIPDAVILPRSAEQVSSIMKLANEEKFSVTPRGAGTSLCGGPIPIKGGVVLDLRHMNKVIEFDEVNRVVIVEAGTTLMKLNGFLQKKGYFFPIDPGSSLAATIGGMLATDASGMHSPKYGTTGDLTLGLEVVLPTGEIIKTGSRCLKCVSVGENLTKLFIGSEGTLGIITKAIMKAFKPPEYFLVVVGYYHDVKVAGRAVSEIVKSNIPVSAVEYMDGTLMKMVKAFTGLPLPEAEAMVIVECDGLRKAVEEYTDRILEILNKEAFKVEKAKTKEEAAEFWVARKAAYGTLSRFRPTMIIEDPAVPVSKLPEFIERLEKIGNENNIEIVNFGHAGEGNLHPTIMFDERNKDEAARARKAISEIMKATLEFGGTITSEHGVGLAKMEFIKWEYGEEAVNVLRKIKRVLDPNNVLNPSKRE